MERLDKRTSTSAALSTHMHAPSLLLFLRRTPVHVHAVLMHLLPFISFPHPSATWLYPQQLVLDRCDLHGGFSLPPDPYGALTAVHVSQGGPFGGGRGGGRMSRGCCIAAQMVAEDVVVVQSSRRDCDHAAPACTALLSCICPNSGWPVVVLGSTIVMKCCVSIACNAGGVLPDSPKP